MAKAAIEPEIIEEEAAEEEAEEAAPSARIQHDFQRADLNDLRDAVNELFARG